MVEDVRRHCQPEKMRFVKGDAPTCLPGTVLREMLKTFKLKAVEMGVEDDVNAFRPYSKRGGREGHNNHKTKAGLLKTVKEALDDLPEETWVEPEVRPKNPYLRSMLSRHQKLKQKHSLVEKISRDYFKPVLMDDNFDNSWLHTTEIKDAIVNSTRRNRSFAFLGVVKPTENDTQHLKKTLAKMRGKKVYGVVWNTSARDEGEHWVSALFYPKQKVVEYFDSMGNDPPEQLSRQMKNLATSSEGFNEDNWDFHTNTVKHQKGGSQCGMYSIWFIIQRVVEKRSFTDICETVTPDKQVCKLRSHYFSRPHKLVRKVMKQRARQMQVSSKKKRLPSRGNRYNPIVISPDRGNRDKPIELD